MVKTAMPINGTTLKAAGIFFIAVNVLFKVMQGFETSSSGGLYS
jgi:hypothetical protein